MSVAEKALGKASAAHPPFKRELKVCKACAANCYNLLYKSYIVIKIRDFMKIIARQALLKVQNDEPRLGISYLFA
jgi:hypothetical protein